MTTADSPAQAAKQVHPHAIRWDVDQQLWVCSVGCGFTRPKREAEVVPSREEALEEARLAGTGADFTDLKVKAPASGTEPPTDTQPQVPASG